MCCFSGKVDVVADTNIFVRASKEGRQFIVYSMRFKAGDDLVSRNFCRDNRLLHAMTEGTRNAKGAVLHCTPITDGELQLADGRPILTS